MIEKPALIQKFGGTSVSTAQRRAQVIGHVRRARDQGSQVAIVVSAMGRRGDPYATDTLLDLLRADGGPFDRRDYDMVFTCGEIISATVMAHLLKRAGIPAVGLSGAQALIYTDDNHTEAEIVEIDPARLQSHLERSEVPVVAGCQGVVRDIGDYTTLGRGGSDTSAVALGGALNAEKVEIYTDVEGVANVDPKIVPESRLLKQISYAKMHAMARYGAKVIHPRAVRTGWEAGVPVVVRATFSMLAPGTTIADVEDESPIVGIATLGPLNGAVFQDSAIGSAVREDWERRRGIMSLIDHETGALVLGAPPDKAHELNSALEEAGVPSGERTGNQSWVSLVGDSQVLQERRFQDLDLLRQRGIEVLYHEAATQRSTYVVDAGHETDAVRALYRDVFGRM